MNHTPATVALLTPIAIASLAMTSAAHAGSIVQEGTLSGGTGPMVQDVVLDQFDDQDGTLALKAVQLDFLTSLIGGYTTDGSGIAVHIQAILFAEWALNTNILAQTQAMIDTVVPNTAPGTATVFNTDTEAVTITAPADLAAWIGPGTITLEAFTNFSVSEDPAGVIDFGAGGTVRYTVTYEYNVVPAPGTALLLGALVIGRRRRR